MSPKTCTALLYALFVHGCSYPEPERGLPMPSARRFAAEAYPVLLRDCGFPACHGDHGRFFQVFGPGRARLDPATEPLAPQTGEELALSYGRARSMLRGRDGVASAPLLTRPLSVSAGGAGHGGADVWGLNVYRSKEDPGYQVLLGWARSMAEEAP